MAQRPLESPRRPILEGLVRGLLPLYVLHLLEEAPAHGAGIAATIAEMTGGVWSPSPGSLYPTLKRLEREGLVRGRWARGTAAPRRVYEITAAGREACVGLRAEAVDDLRQARHFLDVHLDALGQGGRATRARHRKAGSRGGR